MTSSQSSSADAAAHLSREMLERLPAAVYAVDSDGNIIFFNDAAASLWGKRPEIGQDKWCGSWRLSQPDGTRIPLDQSPMAQVVSTGIPQHNIQLICTRPDGEYCLFMENIELLRDKEGKPNGAFAVLIRADGSGQESDAPHRLAAIVESSNDAIISKNLQGIIKSWNKGAERLFGYTAEEVIGQHISILIPPERLDEEPEIIRRISLGEFVTHYETIRRRKDASLVEISLTVSPIRNARGEIIGASKIARDITDRREAEKAKELLLHELRHRVRNTVGIAQALVSQTLRSATPEERRTFIARLHAMSSALDLLMIENFSEAPLRRVMEKALSPFITEGGATIHTEGPDVLLEWSKATQLALIIHELTTNALKYGALSTELGRVDIRWEWMENTGPERRLKLRWRESGGPTVKTPKTKGFGCQLIDSALDASRDNPRLTFAPMGVICDLEISI